MTKRILAIVLAVVMAMSVLMVEAFAYDYMTGLQATVSGNSITVSGYAVSGASSYKITVKCGTSTVYNGTVSSTSTVVTTSLYGTHSVDVDAFSGANGSGDRIGSGSTKCDVQRSTTSNGITVTSSGSGVTVTWTKDPAISSYFVSYSYYDAYNQRQTSSTSGAGSATINVAYEKLISVSVYAGSSSSSGLVGTWNNNTGSSWGGSTSTGGVTISGTTLYWSNPTYQYCYVSATCNGRTILNRQSVGTTSSFNFGSYISSTYLYGGYPIYFTVSTAYTTIGTATYNANGSYNNGSVYVQGTTLYWTAVPGHYYSVTASGNYGSQTVLAASTTEHVEFSGLVTNSYSTISFTVRDTTTGITVGTATYYPGNFGGTSGNVGISGTTLYWTGSAQVYYVSATQNGRTILSRSRVGAVTSVNIASLINQSYLNSGYPIIFTVYDSYYTTVGTATYYPGSSNLYGTNYNFRVTVTNFNVNVAWDTVPYASTYRVTYQGLTNGSSKQYLDTPFTSANLTLPAGGLYVEVTYYYNNRAYSVGAATISATGQVNYSGTGTNTNTNTNTGSTQSGNYVSGTNCTMTVGATSTLVSWNDYYGATRYQVIYTNVATNQARSVTGIYTNSYEIPLGYDNTTGGISVQVIAYNGVNPLGAGPFAYATYKPTTTNNNNTTTKPADTTPDAPTSFKATASNKQVLLSWNAAKNSTSYKVYWKRSSNSTWKLAKETTKRALTIKGLNNDMNYDFKVVASTGVESSVIKIAPTSSGSNTKTADDPKGSTSSSSSKNPVITSATGGNGTFTVSWNGVSGANSYKVYAHRVGVDVTSDGKQTYYCKATVSGTSATVSNLAAGTYQIRIKASTDGGNTWTSLSACDYYTVTVS